MPTNKEDSALERQILNLPAADEIDLAYGDGVSIRMYDLVQLIHAREEAAEKRGASKAATAINGELGLDLTSNGSYYLERFDRLHSQSQPTMKEAR